MLTQTSLIAIAGLFLAAIIIFRLTRTGSANDAVRPRSRPAHAAETTIAPRND